LDTTKPDNERMNLTVRPGTHLAGSMGQQLTERERARCVPVQPAGYARRYAHWSLTVLTAFLFALTASGATTAVPPIDLPNKYWKYDFDHEMAVHVPSKVGFPRIIGDFRLYECKNLRQPPKSFAASYVTEKQGGLRVVIMIYHRKVLGTRSAEDASKALIADMAIDLAHRNHLPEDRPAGIAFDLRLPGKPVSAYTVVEPPESRDSDANIFWLAVS
jgi:hypothetical protein